jgi:molecular chaperone GrpE (heat shock protein)
MSDQVLEKLDELGASMYAFGKRLEHHLIETESCSRSAFNRLYEEMRQYKDNFVFEVQRGLLQDVLLLYDGIQQLKRHYSTAQDIDGQALMANFDGLAIETEEILLRRGLERLIESPDKLDPYLQKAVRVIKSNDPDEDMAIVERLRVGFRLGDRMFRKEEVVIKKCAQSPPQPMEFGPGDPVSRPAGEAHNK